MKRLNLPAQLVYTVIFTACASPAPMADVPADVQADVPADVPTHDHADAPSDLASDLADALADALTDAAPDAADAVTDVTRDVTPDVADAGCVMSGPLDPPGIYCGNGPGCPNARVCTAADCPAGCRTCRSPLFCIPNNTSDAATSTCAVSLTCLGDDCGDECHSVG